ncbi:AAA family ATPase [Streptomyces albidoflavus]|uniref:Nuclease SbcCD subunit C n=2 Tax=Streptomyces TaxID=1883 RepID=A0A385D789_9ACTN|nr:MULTISPECIES: ATP-binding protein [Streptomyces]AXQ54263.1 chromosome segregation protein SMC [Streptomyces koyangensis]KUL56907.1 chromosome segregation protein SMC [Streptomyces albidoflavus]MBK3387412.1 AAA family ATPase [Streptomyces sp. DEF1AK]MEE1722439.1 AAA family ATPase [Streptomyces sp. JV186]RZE27913.1 chromosome segregation protein SMC [Streptomyces albidoflavus]
MSDQPHPSLRDLVLQRLAAAGLEPETADLLRDLFPGTRAGSASRTGPLFLRSITAAGWRGIGPETMLGLTPAPGLTVVAGRNGSGKSSFAEAAEMALTGDNFRWQDRTQIWRQGWRNLHDPAAPRVEVECRRDGADTPVTVRRSWHGDGLGDARVAVHRPGLPGGELGEVVGAEELALYRPFLSYSELGAVINGPMTALHDGLAQILGLEQLSEAYKEAGARLKAIKDGEKKATDLAAAVLTELRGSGDPRAVAAVEVLSARRPDRERVRTLLAARPEGDTAELERLRGLSTLEGPDLSDISGAVTRLREAAARADDARSGSAEDARRLSDLLERALDHRRRARTADCPVCDTPGLLDDDWAVRAREQVERLQHEAAEAQSARDDLRGAIRAVHDLVQPVPVWLRPEDSPLAALWREWSLCRSATDPRPLADQVERLSAALADACRQESEKAARLLAEQDAGWRPLGVRLAEWLAVADRAAEAASLGKRLKDAQTWLKKVTDELREERLRPFADQSQTIWKLLCERSSVTLGSIGLTGTANQRKVKLDVSVDAMDAPAFGVMSQGELHSLALSLFLPRATHPDSPFGFLVIDDPVQSMDPEKVEGLARVLHACAQRRQVIVFTHDTRLQQAIRHLRIPATIMQVSRQTDSVVKVTRTDDPVSLALSEARAVAKDPNVPQDVADRVLPQMCRGALEAACLEPARRRLRAEGHGHADIEARIGKAHKLTELAALAFYDSTMEPAQVLAAVAQDHGPWARALIERCNAGAHQLLTPIGDRMDLVRDTERLAKAVRGR